MFARLRFVIVCFSALTFASTYSGNAVYAENVTLTNASANHDALRIEIEQLRETGRLSIGGVDIATGHMLAEFYERREFQPTWTSVDQVASLLDLVQDSRDDGLNPNDYHAPNIETIVHKLRDGYAPTLNQRAAMELLLTDSLLRLGYHQLFGRVDPKHLDARWNFNTRPFGADPLTTLQTAIDSPSIVQFANDVFARNPLYLQLREALSRYREIESLGGWPIIADGPTLEVGMTDERVATLARRLTLGGDLNDNIDDSRVYSQRLAAAVKSFQTRHGLDTDGKVGPATRAALNVPATDRIDQLRVNLERARWVMGGLGKDFIVVNIAGFRAYLVNSGKPVWSTKVQVGAPYHQTPVFRDELAYVVINPTWTVPYSIATKEMLPKIKQNPNYFSERTFDIRTSDGDTINPDAIDWASLSRKHFPYTFVQRPGPSNALGRIKFIFPNEYSVYLHDTPSRQLFDRSERAFSHGCIRTQNPFDLAERLLAPEGWDRARIDTQVASLETQTVYLSEPLPVLLLYWTTEVGPAGEVHFYKDVYQRDQKVLDALNAPFEGGVHLGEIDSS